MTDLHDDIMLPCITVLFATMVMMMMTPAASRSLPDLCVCVCPFCGVFVCVHEPLGPKASV